MSRKSKKRYIVTANVIEILEDYNKMCYYVSEEEAKKRFKELEEILADEICLIDEYVYPSKRVHDCLYPRGVIMQLFCKENIFGTLSYYWEDRVIVGKLKKKIFITRTINSQKLVKTKIPEIIVINGKELEFRKDMDLFQEFYYTF